MATSSRTVAPLIAESRMIGKPITMISVDWDVDADGSLLAMEAIHNAILSRGTIIAAGAVYDTGTKQDFILEGNLTDTINNFTSLDEVLEYTDCPIGDKCESCQDEGFNNDGFNIPMVLAMVKRNTLPKS